MTAQEVFDRMETLDMDRILTLETLIPITQYDALQIYCAANSLANSLHLYCWRLDSEDDENVEASNSVYDDLDSLRKTIRMPEEIDESCMYELADKIKVIGYSVSKTSVILEIAAIVKYHLPELRMRADENKYEQFLRAYYPINISESPKSDIVESFSKFMMSIQPKEWIKNE